MISQPDAPMLDSKLFVSRFDGAFPDLYERLWDGVEWIWVNHGRPQGLKLISAPGAAMLDEKLFVIAEDGALWERHWRADLARWAWSNHGRPENRRLVYTPGAAMLDEKLFVVAEDGALWERHWRDDLDRWAWQDHGRPADQRIVSAPACAMMNEKLFVVAETGNLWERHWRNDLGRWAWSDHGRPNNERIRFAPGAAMLDEKLFVGAADGHLYERHWRADLGRWAWDDHGAPPGTSVATAPGAAMLDSKFFVGAANAHLFERVWTGAQWEWVDHGSAFHDQSAHVIGSPGSDPKFEVAVMGDGYAEGDMDAYRSAVQNLVVAAFDLDALGRNRDKVRVIRIDVVSPVSGVTERDYDEAGTPAEDSDDVLISENFRFSRLGFVSTGIWSHCWLETSARTGPRIDSIRARFAPNASNVIVLVNTGEPGGCNRGDTAAFTRSESHLVVAHELGHNMFDLGDEYNNNTLDNTAVRGEANLTETLADWSTLKWGAFVGAGTALPTDASNLPGGWNNETSVGAFEGGGGHFSTGIFRPVLRCRMNQNSPPWCPVCAGEIDRILGAFP